MNHVRTEGYREARENAAPKVTFRSISDMLSYSWRSATPLPAARNSLPTSSCAALDC